MTVAGFTAINSQRFLAPSAMPRSLALWLLSPQSATLRSGGDEQLVLALGRGVP
jgi:hypothetical protein